MTILAMVTCSFATQLIIHKTDGSQHPFDINQIQSITFAAGGIEGNFTDDFETQTLENWTIGGRQQGTNEASVVYRNNSYRAYLFQSEFSEITIENVFNYEPTMTFSFDMELK